jgi:exopolysaccharide production protein ExoQ
MSKSQSNFLIYIIKLLGWTYGLLLILSLLFAVGIPQFEIMSGLHDAAWQEIFTHKNHFGAFMAPGGVIFLLNALKGERFSWVYWGLLLLNCRAMIMSQSTTVMGIFELMLILCIIYHIFRWRCKVMINAVLEVTIINNSFWAICVAIYSLVIVKQDKYAIAE